MKMQLVKFHGGLKDGQELWLDIDQQVYQIRSIDKSRRHSSIVIEIYELIDGEAHYQGNKAKKFNGKTNLIKVAATRK